MDHSKHRHVFVVIRVDEYERLEVALEQRIVVTKVFQTWEAAEVEVARLRKINAGKSCTYFWTVGRLVEETVPAE
jgi:hypothetical protein